MPANITDYDTCQTLYKTILIMNAGAISNHTPYLIREIDKTRECDTFYNLSRLRRDFEQPLGPETLKNITDFHTNDVDNRKIEQVVFHNYILTDNYVYRALSLKNKLWYHTSFVLIKYKY